MPKVNIGDAVRLPIPLAPMKEQVAVACRLREMFETHTDALESAKSAFASYAVLNQSILAKAFRGELVPQDPNDEPANVLLERIRAEREAAEAVKKASKKTRGRKGR